MMTVAWHGCLTPGPNTTSFFVYGARLDPSVNNRFLRILPGGRSRTYTYTIPADHPPGLFWSVHHTHLLPRFPNCLPADSRCVLPPLHRAGTWTRRTVPRRCT